VSRSLAAAANEIADALEQTGQISRSVLQRRRAG